MILRRARLPLAAVAAAAAGSLLWGQQRQPAGLSEAPAEKKQALSKKEFRAFTLRSTERVSPNTQIYRFDLPSAEHESGLSVASCLVAKAEVDGKTVVRPYTPISLNDQRGHLDLMVKSYPAPGGLMSRYIESLKVGDELNMKGPFQKFAYAPNKWKRIGMVAGGTGITPMLQVIREVLGNPNDKTEVHLIFANVTEADILLRDEIDALAYLYPNFKVFYTLDKPPYGWKQGTGFVTFDMLKAHLPEAVEENQILVCGPKGFISHVAGAKGPKMSQGDLGGLLEDLGWAKDSVYKF